METKTTEIKREKWATIRRIRIWLEEWSEEHERVRQAWNSRWIGVPMWIFFGALTVYWYFKVPSPGKSIGVLAVVAGIMSVREMKTLAKASWVVLLICLLVTEFRAIDTDRAENQKQQAEFFREQREGFQNIQEQANKDFAATVGGLETIIGDNRSHFDKTSSSARRGRCSGGSAGSAAKTSRALPMTHSPARCFTAGKPLNAR